VKAYTEELMKCITTLDYFTPEYCLKLVRVYPFYLARFKDYLKTKEVCLAAVEGDGYLLKEVPDEFKTAELCLAAVKQYPGAMEFVPDEIKTEEFIKATGEQEEFSRVFFEQAEEAAGKDDVDGALELYTKALGCQEHPSIYSQRAKAYERKGENDKALADYEKALSMPADEYYKPSGSYFNRAELYSRLKDYDNAIADYTRAIEAGFDTDYPSHAGKAQKGIAYVLTDKGIAAYNAKDNDTAFPLWLKAAEMGHMWAQSNVANCYSQGWGTPVDKEKYVYWLQKASEQGHGQACYNLANGYLDGTGGLPVDKEKAVEYYKKAVEAGYEKAKAKLEELNVPLAAKTEEKAEEDAQEDAQLTAEEEFEKGQSAYENEDYAEAVKWYLKAAEKGHASAQFNLYDIYREGKKGVKANMNEALKWVLKAAEQGDDAAQECLCLDASHIKDDGVSKDTAENVIKWIKENAEQGNAYAQYGLGCAYFYGDGFPEDEKEGIKWLEKAEAQGNELAQEELDEIKKLHKQFGMD
jgi:TPR repeat protein